MSVCWSAIEIARRPLQEADIWETSINKDGYNGHRRLIPRYRKQATRRGGYAMTQTSKIHSKTHTGVIIMRSD